MEAHIEANTSELNEKMKEVIGYFDCEIEGRFEHMRCEETNTANFVSDLIRTNFDNCDLTLLNSGTLRTNHVIPAGDITIRTI